MYNAVICKLVTDPIEYAEFYLAVVGYYENLHFVGIKRSEFRVPHTLKSLNAILTLNLPHWFPGLGLLLFCL